MGTSTSYQAPTTFEWRTAKGNFTRFMKEGGAAGGGVAGVANAYVRAHGGASKLASSTVSAKASLKRLGSFLGDVARLGFEGALRENGLGELIGQDVEAVLLGIANLICNEGATHEEADARHAAMETFNTLLDEATTEADVGTLIEGKANKEGVEELFEKFVVRYVYGRMVRELGERGESTPIDTPNKIARSHEILDYISSRVKLEMTIVGNIVNFDFNGKEGEEIVDRVFQDAYEVFML